MRFVNSMVDHGFRLHYMCVDNALIFIAFLCQPFKGSAQIRFLAVFLFDVVKLYDVLL